MDKQSVKEFFDRLAPQWDAEMIRSDEIIGLILDNAGVAEGKDILDVACGTGVLIPDYLWRNVRSVTAIDLSPKMVELAKAAELYGIAVQVYFGYKPEQLTEEDTAAMEAAAGAISIPSSCAEVLTGTLPAGVTQRTKTVLFESDNSLRQYYYIDDAIIGNYAFTLNGTTVTPVKNAAGKYNVDQPNIASGLLSTEYTFTVSDGTDTYTIRSSALGYAYDRQENSTNPNMVNLSKLLYRYSQAADAYFGS